MNRVGGVAHLPGGVGADLFGSGGFVGNTV